MVTNKETQQIKSVASTQLEEMEQMLVEQGRRLRELEARLQREKQEKANLEMDFQHLLDQITILAGSDRHEAAMVCG